MAVDNRPGLEQAITHLIRVHGLKSIAFVRGTEQNPEAEQRYRVYADVLAAHELPLDERLVCSGDFLFQSGVEAVKTWYDERARSAPTRSSPPTTKWRWACSASSPAAACACPPRSR